MGNRCNLCGSDERQLLFNKNGVDIVKCTNCGLVYAYPQISDEKMKKLYIRKDWEPTIDYTNDRSNEIRVKILKMLKPIGNLLDIGCGYGGFLEKASRVYKTMGIDISPLKVNFGRGKLHQNIIEGNIYEIPLPQNKFDIVTLIRVIEHLKDVSFILKRINRTLKLRGLLFIKTGNIDSRTAQKKEEEWEYIDPPYHLFYFSQKTIKKMLEKNGFKVIKITPGNLDISRFLGCFASSPEIFFFHFLEILLSIREYLKGNSMMDIFALKVRSV